MSGTPPSRTSLRRRLILLLLGVLAPVWLLLALGAYLLMLQKVDTLFDHQLERVAATLFSLDLEHMKAAQDAPGFHVFDDEDSFPAYIWSSDGRLLFRTEFAPKLPFIPNPPRIQTEETEEGRWRVIRVKDAEGGNWLVVARPYKDRALLALDLAATLVIPWVLCLLVMVVLVWLAVGKGLSPLYELSRQIAGRKPDDLSPVAVAATPQEASPLVEEINLLLARVEGALDKERRFTADASHELRTPLAAIRAQVEVAEAATEREVREHALAQAHKGVVRAGRLVEQLLTLARLDHLDAIADSGTCDLLLLAREELVDCTASALKKGVELELEGNPAPLRGSPDLLRLAIRNLLDNAIAHTPADGLVTVRVLRQDDGECVLSVLDSGEGVAADALPRLGERFYRAGASRPGSGLGLSIVARIVALHGGRLALSSPIGFMATLHLPAL
ncbi:sensor histidine kinase family protein [Chitinimonas naiadis]